MGRSFHPPSAIRTVAVAGFALFFWFAFSQAQNTNFHNAPESAKETKNPFQGPENTDAGKRLYMANCSRCHGRNAEGSGNIPALVDGVLESTSDGEIFWFITNGDQKTGMPSFAKLPEEQRWQLVTYVKGLGLSQTSTSNAAPEAAATTSKIKAPPPTPPFTDFRYEQPGKFRKITVDDLPQPYATSSAENGPDVVARPANAWPKAPAGFKVDLYAEGLNNPRLMRTAPNGDVFLAESNPGRIRVFRGITSDGKAELSAIFASGLKRPYGINFYPPGPNPQWIYVGTTMAVYRLPYHNGDLKATGSREHIADLPGPEGHWTRDIQFSPDGKKMFVGVGS